MALSGKSRADIVRAYDSRMRNDRDTEFFNIQTISIGPIGARLPIVQGTSFAFIPILIPIAKVLMTSGLLPASVIAIVLNLLLPDQNADAKKAPREQEQVVV